MAVSPDPAWYQGLPGRVSVAPPDNTALLHINLNKLASHYANAGLSRQFDAYVWFDETRAVTPLAANAQKDRMPDTFPFGL